MKNNSRFQSIETHIVQQINFSTLSKDDILKLSVIEVNSPRIVDGDKGAYNGPNDPRLGVSIKGVKCQTCGLLDECPGHFGHIVLHEPVFHYGYLNYICLILRCVCHHCHKLRVISDRGLRSQLAVIARTPHPLTRLKKMVRFYSQIQQCARYKEERVSGKPQLLATGCGLSQAVQVYVRDRTKIIGRLRKERGVQHKQFQYTPLMVKEIFKDIPTQDALILGFKTSSPLDLLVQVLLVSPPQIRPRVQTTSLLHCEDDLTIAYSKIVSYNKELKLNKEDPPLDYAKQIQKLVGGIMVKKKSKQAVVFAKPDINYVSRQKKQVMKKILSIQERLQSKQGRFRQHLMGKRVDFSARSVISPDPTIKLGQLGVPEYIAGEITIPERVTQWNYKNIFKLCQQKKISFSHKCDEFGRIRQHIPLVRYAQYPQQLKKHLTLGSIVERKLVNGDYVLFNRQPTLHRMSMMGHKVRILPGHTFRLNLSVCTPYNADFDGDQMNMHVPQSPAVTAQIKELSAVGKQMMGPRNNSPVMGLVQDSLLGMFLITNKQLFFTQAQAYNFIVWANPDERPRLGELPYPAIMYPKKLWTGKQIASMILPQALTLKIFKDSQGYRNIHDNSLIIVSGNIISGVFKKQFIGSGSGLLLHALLRQFGVQQVQNFISYSQQLANIYLMHRGFTVGASDVMMTQKLLRIRRKQINLVKKQYYKTTNNYRNVQKINLLSLHQKGRKIKQSVQFKVNLDLNNALSIMQNFVTARIAQENNNIYEMINAKSKGSETNLTQIMFCLGNQNVDGQRVPLGFDNRALPHFRKNDNSPEPRGFVFSSFLIGLKPHQMFFHAMGGRQGLSDTAVKTSTIGYIQRKLVKALQDLVVCYDNSVRDSQGNLIQKYYGQDGFLGQFVEKHNLNEVQLSAQQFNQKYIWDRTDPQVQHIGGVQINHLFREQQALKRARIKMIQFVSRNDQKNIQYFCPVKVDRIIPVVANCYSNKEEDVIAPPQFIAKQVQKLAQYCIVPFHRNQLRQILVLTSGKVTKQVQDYIYDYGGIILYIHLRLSLASKRLYKNYKLSKGQFILLIYKIRQKIQQSYATAGEAVGALAAQSIGQPTTQMTLNTFHLAGISQRNVTLGLPRLGQLLDASKNIKTPQMKIYLKQRILQKNKQNDSIKGKITNILTFLLPKRNIKDFLVKTQIFFIYSQQNKIEVVDQSKKNTMVSPWTLKLYFNYVAFSLKKIWNAIIQVLQSFFQSMFSVQQQIPYGYQQINPIINLRVKPQSLQKCSFQLIRKIQSQIGNIFLTGISRLQSVRTSKQKVIIYDKVTQKKIQQEEMIFLTSGSNLRACLSHGFIDTRRTYTNDISQINQVLGIEAARKAFIIEFQQILKPYSIYINHRHISILSQWMTIRGYLTPINRYGINRAKDISILRKASFQQTVDMLFEAAIFCNKDKLNGASERIMFGSHPKLGTKICQLVINPKLVQSYNHKATQYTYIPSKQTKRQIQKMRETPNLNISPKNLTFDQINKSFSPNYDNFNFNFMTFSPKSNPSYDDVQSNYDSNQSQTSPKLHTYYHYNYQQYSPAYKMDQVNKSRSPDYSSYNKNRQENQQGIQMKRPSQDIQILDDSDVDEDYIENYNQIINSPPKKQEQFSDYDYQQSSDNEDEHKKKKK